MIRRVPTGKLIWGLSWDQDQSWSCVQGGHSCIWQLVQLMAGSQAGNSRFFFGILSQLHRNTQPKTKLWINPFKKLLEVIHFSSFICCYCSYMCACIHSACIYSFGGVTLHCHSWLLNPFPHFLWFAWCVSVKTQGLPAAASAVRLGSSCSVFLLRSASFCLRRSWPCIGDGKVIFYFKCLAFQFSWVLWLWKS